MNALRILPESEVSHAQRLYQLAQYLAFRGRLKEIEASLPAVVERDHDVDLDFDEPDHYLPPRFINAVEAGYLTDAQTMAPLLAEYVLRHRRWMN